MNAYFATEYLKQAGAELASAVQSCLAASGKKPQDPKLLISPKNPQNAHMLSTARLTAPPRTGSVMPRST